jgi:hypothetical protein
MIKRFKTSLGVAAGLSALALGGSAIAGAASTAPTKAKPAPSHEVTTPDTDNIQSGDQTTPDGTSKAKAKTIRHGAKVGKTEVSVPENSTSETAGETSGETAPNNDGPGGWADEPGNPNADTQQQGQN